MPDPKIFAYTNYRLFLKDALASLLDEGESLRSLGKKSGFSNPAFFQSILSERRNLTPASARKVANGLGLLDKEAQYLLLLVKLDRSQGRTSDLILEKMRSLVEGNKVKKHDPSVHSHWLHGLLYSLVAIPGFLLTPEHIKDVLRVPLNDQELESSIKYIKQKQWILPTTQPGIYKQGDFKFAALNDVRRIEIQRSHLQYLDLAKHRLHDDVSEREFQGFTVAIPEEKLSTF